jgi:hypothetical protein
LADNFCGEKLDKDSGARRKGAVAVEATRRTNLLYKLVDMLGNLHNTVNVLGKLYNACGKMST